MRRSGNEKTYLSASCWNFCSFKSTWFKISRSSCVRCAVADGRRCSSSAHSSLTLAAAFGSTQALLWLARNTCCCCGLFGTATCGVLLWAVKLAMTFDEEDATFCFSFSIARFLQSLFTGPSPATCFARGTRSSRACRWLVRATLAANRRQLAARSRNRRLCSRGWKSSTRQTLLASCIAQFALASRLCLLGFLLGLRTFAHSIFARLLFSIISTLDFCASFASHDSRFLSSLVCF